MSKILVMTSTYPLNDADTQPRFVEYLSNGLAKEHAVSVLAPAIRGQRGQRENRSIQVHRYRYGPELFEQLSGGDGVLENLKRKPLLLLMIPMFLVSQFICAYRLIHRKEIEIVHAHWMLPQGLVALLVVAFMKRKPRVIITSHGGDLFALNRFPLRYIKKWVLGRADAVTVVSHAMKARCIDEFGLDAGKVMVAPMGVDLTGTFVPVGDKIAKRIVFVGRLAEKKGVGVLLAALSKIQHGVGVSVDIVGGGSAMHEYIRMSETNGLSSWVRFHGAKKNSEVVTFLQRAQIAVFPFVVAKNGDQEGLGLTMIEAMGCECAVVASDLSAVKDVITDGDTGVLSPSGDADALAIEIDRLIYDTETRTRLAERGRDFAVHKFDWGAATEKYLRLIETLIEGPGTL